MDFRDIQKPSFVWTLGRPSSRNLGGICTFVIAVLPNVYLSGWVCPPAKGFPSRKAGKIFDF